MEVEEDEWPEEIKNASPEDLMTRVRMLDNDIRVRHSLQQGRYKYQCILTCSTLFIRQIMRSEQIRLNHEENNMKEKIKDNTTKIRDNKQLPYLVAKIVEVHMNLNLDHQPEC